MIILATPVLWALHQGCRGAEHFPTGRGEDENQRGRAKKRIHQLIWEICNAFIGLKSSCDNLTDNDEDEDQPLLPLSWALQCSTWRGFWWCPTNEDGNGGDHHRSRGDEPDAAEDDGDDQVTAEKETRSLILFGPLFYFWCTYAAVSYCGGDKLAKIGRGLAIKSGQNHNDHFLQQPDLTGQSIIRSARSSFSHTASLQI